MIRSAGARFARRRSGGPYRNPWDWPFSKASFYNIGIGSNAAFAAANDPMTVQLSGATWGVNSASNPYDVPVWVGSASDYAYTCNTAADDTGPNGGTRPSAPTQAIRIPSNAQPSSGTDGMWMLFDKTQPGVCWTMNNRVTFNNAQDGSGGPSGYSFFAQMSTTGDGAPYDQPYGAYNCGGGVIRAWELDAGAIKHMLRCAIGDDMLKSTTGSAYNVGIHWPEIAQDYNGSTAYGGSIPWGTCMAIPSVAAGGPNLTTLGLTPGGLILATAMQTYGMIVNDATENGQLVMYGDQDTEGTAGRLQLIQDMATDLPALRAHIRVITNQSTNGAAGTVNGGGSYPTPPPDFDPALGIGTG